MNCDQCIELLDDYAIGILNEAEFDKVSAHLASDCARCNHQFEHVINATAALSASLPPIEPPSALKAKLMAQIRSEAPTSAVKKFAPLSDGASTVELASSVQRRYLPASTLRSWLYPLAACVVGVVVGYSALSQPEKVQPASMPDASVLAARAEAESELRTKKIEFHWVSSETATPPSNDGSASLGGYAAYDPIAEELHVLLRTPEAIASEHRLAVVVRTSDGSSRTIGMLDTSVLTQAHGVFPIRRGDAKFDRLTVIEVNTPSDDPDMGTVRSIIGFE